MKVEAEDIRDYILKLIDSRKKIGQEPTGDDLYAVLGHLTLIIEGEIWTIRLTTI